MPKNMTKVPAKMRFEVFKRDGFKCQYCGRSAPEIILHCDHILARAKGGKNTLLNLITSCIDCNLGKSDRKLDDSAAVTKAKAQADDLQERRNQIEMMAKWYAELETQKRDEVSIVDDAIAACCKFRLSDSGKKKVKALVRKHGLALTVEKFQEAFESGPEDSEEFEEAFTKASKLLKWSTIPFHIQKATYITAVIRNKYSNFYPWFPAFKEVLILVLQDFPEESDKLYRMAANSRQIDTLRDSLCEYAVSLGIDEEVVNNTWNNN